MKLTASLTVTIFSAASSGISHPNSSSKAITSSTVSRLSAPRSSIKLAFSVTFVSSTPKCSTTIFLTRSETSLIRSFPQWFAGMSFTQSARALAARYCHPAPRRTRESQRRHISYFPTTTKSPSPVGGSVGSYHEHATVDVQGLAGDVGSLGACQVNHRGRDFLCRTKPPSGNRFG